MTTIVGYARDGQVVIGGDSQTSYSGCLYTRISKKVIRLGEFIIGCSGAKVTLQKIEFGLTIPERACDETDEQYIKGKFAPPLKDCLDEQSELIIGYRGRVYVIGIDTCVSEMPYDIAAIGSGGEFALGSMWQQLKDNPDVDMETAVMNALACAAFYNADTAGPFMVISTQEE